MRPLRAITVTLAALSLAAPGVAAAGPVGERRARLPRRERQGARLRRRHRSAAHAPRGRALGRRRVAAERPGARPSDARPPHRDAHGPGRGPSSDPRCVGLPEGGRGRDARGRRRAARTRRARRRRARERLPRQREDDADRAARPLPPGAAEGADAARQLRRRRALGGRNPAVRHPAPRRGALHGARLRPRDPEAELADHRQARAEREDAGPAARARDERRRWLGADALPPAVGRAVRARADDDEPHRRSASIFRGPRASIPPTRRPGAWRHATRPCTSRTRGRASSA